MKHSEAGKGSKPRPVDQKKFDENFDKIFGKNKKKKDNDTSPARS